MSQMTPHEIAMGGELLALAEAAIARHTEVQGANPRRPAAAYLRAALPCARELARRARTDAEQRAVALRLIERIMVVARAAEDTCFSAGGNSAPYFTVLAAAGGLHMRLTLLVLAADEASATATPKKATSAPSATRVVPVQDPALSGPRALVEQWIRAAAEGVKADEGRGASDPTGSRRAPAGRAPPARR